MSKNTMCDYIIEKYREGVTHDNIVACHNLLSCCIYTAIVSPIFGRPSSCNILFRCFYYMV